MTPGESSSEDDAVSVVGDQLTDVGLLSAGVWVFCGVPWGAVSEDQVPPSFLVSVFVTLSVFPCFHPALLVCTSPFLALQASFPLKTLAGFVYWLEQVPRGSGPCS